MNPLLVFTLESTNQSTYVRGTTILRHTITFLQNRLSITTLATFSILCNCKPTRCPLIWANLLDLREPTGGGKEYYDLLKWVDITILSEGKSGMDCNGQSILEECHCMLKNRCSIYGSVSICGFDAKLAMGFDGPLQGKILEETSGMLTNYNFIIIFPVRSWFMFVFLFSNIIKWVVG